tara:strand:+ start:147 stop:410 length:264 start_codon:yes stop_codon:yes gene_type:complete
VNKLRTCIAICRYFPGESATGFVSLVFTAIHNMTSSASLKQIILRPNDQDFETIRACRHLNRMNFGNLSLHNALRKHEQKTVAMQQP